MKPLSPRILIIEDDGDISELIQLMLKSDSDYEITCVLTSEEGLRLTATQGFDLYVLDYNLRGITGIEVCRTLRQIDPDTSVMFFTGEAHARKREEAMQAGADAYLVKPNDLIKLTETVKQLLGVNQPTPCGAYH